MLIFSFVIQNEMEELLIFMNSERGDSSLHSKAKNGAFYIMTHLLYKPQFFRQLKTSVQNVPGVYVFLAQQPAFFCGQILFSTCWHCSVPSGKSS